jgi:hypothetical protein
MGVCRDEAPRRIVVVGDFVEIDRDQSFDSAGIAVSASNYPQVFFAPVAHLPDLITTENSWEIHMTTTLLANPVELIEEKTRAIIDEVIESLPDPKLLTSEERRGIIARYSSVLEGNFIYWMTATAIATKADQSGPILLDNLYEEVHDCHPLMMRKFAIAANAFPTDKDALAVNDDLTKVRLFLGHLQPVKSVLMMAFFEGFIQKFMSYLADLAARQGSTEMEYTDVHGVCDIEHTEGLFRVLAAEIELASTEPEEELFEGVTLLRTLIERMIHPVS